jgi:hypothetical protein
MSTEKKIFDETTEDKFELLKLINCTNIDAFLKVLLLVDEKTSNNIRGELNHMMLKHIESDPKLREKLMVSDIAELNYGRLHTMTKNIKKEKIAYYKTNIKKVILDELNISGFRRLMSIINLYFRDIELYDNTTDRELTVCATIEKNLNAIFDILTPNMTNKNNIWFDGEWNQTINTVNDIVTVFCVHFEKQSDQDSTIYRIHVDFEVTELPEINIEKNIRELYDYYHLEEPEKTLEYYHLSKRSKSLLSLH